MENSLINALKILTVTQEDLVLNKDLNNLEGILGHSYTTVFGEDGTKYIKEEKKFILLLEATQENISLISNLKMKNSSMKFILEDDSKLEFPFIDLEVIQTPYGIFISALQIEI